MNLLQKFLYEKAIAEGRTPLLHPDHKLPRTRREFMGQGFLGMASFAFAPTLLSLISQRAYGLDCGGAETPQANKIAPYLHVELNGGWGGPGNAMFGKQRSGAAFQPLGANSYDTLGLSAAQHPNNVALITDFGMPYHPRSQFIAAMRAVMSPEAQAKTVSVGMAGTSMDDTANNPLNGAQLAVAISGAPATIVQVAGNQATNTGGRDRPLDVGDDPSLSKARVRQLGDLRSLVDAGLLESRLSKEDATRIATAAQNMSATQLAAFSAKQLPEQIRTLVECGYQGATELLTGFGPETLDPTNDPAAAGLFNLAQNNDQQVAGIAKLLLDGNAAAGTIQMGGFDYHGRGRAAQDAKDAEAGRNVGLALEFAHRKNMPLFIAVTSDGGVSAQNGEFRSDSGSRGCTLMFAISETVGAKPATRFNQIGAYSDAGAVDTGYGVQASDARTQALAIVYNYAAMTGSIAQFEQYLQKSGIDNPFKGKDNDYMAFMDIKAV